MTGNNSHPSASHHADGTIHPGKQPLVMTITSGKGGVGKSFVAANIACALSKAGHCVLLWDTDRQFPNQHLLFGVEPPRRAGDVYAGKISASSALYELDKNLFLLADKNGAGTKFSPSNIVYIFQELAREKDFDIIIFDTPAGAGDEVLQTCALSDIIGIVVSDEPTSILDAYGLTKILLPYVAKENLYLIVNNTIDAEDAQEVAQKLNLATEKFLGIHLSTLGFVPYDRAARLSILQQEPLFRSYPQSEAATSIASLAGAVSKLIRDHAG